MRNSKDSALRTPEVTWFCLSILLPWLRNTGISLYRKLPQTVRPVQSAFPFIFSFPNHCFYLHLRTPEAFHNSVSVLGWESGRTLGPEFCLWHFWPGADSPLCAFSLYTVNQLWVASCCLHLPDQYRFLQGSELTQFPQKVNSCIVGLLDTHMSLFTKDSQISLVRPKLYFEPDLYFDCTPMLYYLNTYGFSIWHDIFFFTNLVCKLVSIKISVA